MPAARSATVLAYHARTKHRLERYAAGPQTLDWDARPDPFRRFAGAPAAALPLPADGEDLPWPHIFSPGAVAPRPPTRDSVGLLFELSFALSAWKQSGPDRWALRCTPSSGNLHPTEVYLLARGVEGLEDGLHHYTPREHALELRARTLPCGSGEAVPRTPRLLVGFSSIHWREAWKYGERAFRYCQLDMGHAVGALRYAAAVLGWRVQACGLEHAAIAQLLGLDRADDFAGAEREEAEDLFELRHSPAQPGVEDLLAWMAGGAWSGHANRLDARPMYRWPVIDEGALASRRDTRVAASPLPPMVERRLPPGTCRPAAALIRSRRSAQQFDRRARLDAGRFWPIAAALMPRTADAGAPLPWDVWTAEARLHAVLFAHRIDGLAPGTYLLPRDAAAQPALRAALPHLAWRPVAASPPEVPLYELAPNPALAGTLRTLSCHQAIGAEAVFVIALLADFRPAIDGEPWRYRELLREAGLVGQVLYLEAEAAGLRGTGIGCYFDDPVHALLGLPDAPPARWQVVYHFSVGLPLTDERIASEAPYGARARQEDTP